MTHLLTHPRLRHLIPLLAVLLVLLVIYLPTLQTIINGSSDLKMIDVGETQVVLNTWGTLHATGYPLFVILGNLLVIGFKAIGVDGATAASLVSMVWGLLALGVLYTLIYHLTGRIGLAVLVVGVFGLTRFVWIHQITAEIYSFSLLWLIGLLLLAVWRHPVRHRILWLAVLGGLAVGHYRTIGFIAPALIYATLPEVLATLKRPRYLAACVVGAVLGFLPYIYLPLRAKANARWVYGSPDTWDEFWFQFTAGEAGYLFHAPESQAQLMKNWARINTLLVDELSLLGVLLGLVGLVVGLLTPRHRRVTITFILATIPAYVFAVGFYYDILALVILNMTLTLVLGWVFLADGLLTRLASASTHGAATTTPLLNRSTWGLAGLAVLAVVYGVWLHGQNYDYLYGLTHDRTGLETIALAEQAPTDATFMLAWGPRYFAVGFAQDVLGQLEHIERADHNADFPAIMATSRLITPEYTLYAQNEQWWAGKLGTPIYLQAVAPQLVEIRTERQFYAETPAREPDAGVMVVNAAERLTCTAEQFVVTVDWVAVAQPDRDLSVFVHLLDANGAVIAQDDRFAPVFGRRPFSTWQANEWVQDVYALPRLPNAATIRYGLYEQVDGVFVNMNVVELVAVCP